MCRRIGHILVYGMSSKIRQQFHGKEKFAMNTDILTSGSMVKNHISLKTGFGHNATRRTSFLSWFQALSTSSSSMFAHHSTSKTPSRQESHCSYIVFLKLVFFTNDMTTSTVISETREREDRIETDTSPDDCVNCG